MFVLTIKRHRFNVMCLGLALSAGHGLGMAITYEVFYIKYIKFLLAMQNIKKVARDCCMTRRLAYLSWRALLCYIIAGHINP